jgi:hypothetical protein
MVNWLDSLYSHLPRLGPELREFVVRLLPILALLFGVLIAFSSIVDLLGTPLVNVFTMGGGATLFQKLMVPNILGVIEGVFLIVAFRGLQKRSKKGWTLVLWSQILWIVAELLSLSPAFILGFLFFYPLFQVRSHYK